VIALLSYDHSLFVGGWFTTAGGKPSAYIALWDDTTPIEISNLAAVATQDGVQLRWEMSGEARREIWGIRVQRADTPLGPYMTITPRPFDPSLSMVFIDADVQAGQHWYRLAILPRQGSEEFVGPIAVSVGEQSRWQTHLYAPFEPSAGGTIEIRYSIGRSQAPVRLEVFDVTGRFLRSLDQGIRGPGEYAQLWNRRDHRGSRVARGVYLVHLVAGDAQASTKLVLAHE
jgi:hypothetical protein